MVEAFQLVACYTIVVRAIENPIFHFMINIICMGVPVFYSPNETLYYIFISSSAA